MGCTSVIGLVKLHSLETRIKVGTVLSQKFDVLNKQMRNKRTRAQAFPHKVSISGFLAGSQKQTSSLASDWLQMILIFAEIVGAHTAGFFPWLKYF